MKSAALRHTDAACIVWVAFQLQPFGSQPGKSQVGDGVHRFGHVAVATVGHVLPVADGELWYLPVGIVQAAAANQLTGGLEEDEHGHVLALEVAVAVAQDGHFGASRRDVGPVGPGQPGGEVIFGLDDGVVQRFAIAGLRAANEQALGFNLRGNLWRRPICHADDYGGDGRFWRVGGEL